MKFSQKNWELGELENTIFLGGHFEFFFSKKNRIISMKTSSPFIWGLIYFCTMDGFFRIFEKTSSELICTRLYMGNLNYLFWFLDENPDKNKENSCFVNSGFVKKMWWTRYRFLPSTLPRQNRNQDLDHQDLPQPEFGIGILSCSQHGFTNFE